MELKHSVRNFAQRFGFDVVRYPLANPLARTVQLLNHYRIDCVLDVGANSGGFGSAIRRHGFAGRIISFEPLHRPYEFLLSKAENDGNWDAFRLAIGNSDGQLTVNVSGNAGLSSSALPMLDLHASAAPHSRYVGAESVRQERLDALFPTLGLRASNRVFLKVDVQGYEKAVLDGAGQLFSDRAFLGLQLELSLAPLYAGAMSYREGLDFAERAGMTIMGLDPVFADPKTGRLLQADAVFFLPEEHASDSIAE